MRAEPLFDPSDGVMHTLALASGSGTNFREAVIESRKSGSNFSIDYLVTDKEYKKPGSQEKIGALDYADLFKIPHATINGYKYCGNRKVAQESVEGLQEYEKKSELFNGLLYTEIRQFEELSDIKFDTAVLTGYMRLFKSALLRRFCNRALNVHPAALDVFASGKRKYIGGNAVFDALNAGEERTRSSVIIVDADTDAGAILASGPWVEYNGPRPVTQESADEHQSRQKELSDWPTLRFALREISHGKLALHRKKFHKDGNPVVVYNGNEMPYDGFSLE